MKLTIAHRGQQHQLELDGSPSTATLSTLQEQIESQTSIPVHLQKLLPGKPPKGGGPAPKIAGHAPDETLEKVGLQDGHKIMLLGVTGQELDQVNRQELKVAARLKPRQLHESLLRSAKVSDISECLTLVRELTCVLLTACSHAIRTLRPFLPSAKSTHIPISPNRQQKRQHAQKPTCSG